jgi:hypothetical protein
VNTDRVYIVILLVIGIIVLSNLMMFALVRAFRGVKFDWFSKTKGNLSQPFNYEDKSLDELRRRVEDLPGTHTSSEDEE